MKHETHQFCPYTRALTHDLPALADAEERAYRERLGVADRLAQAEVEELLTEAERDEAEGHDEPRDHGQEWGL